MTEIIDFDVSYIEYDYFRHDKFQKVKDTYLLY